MSTCRAETSRLCVAVSLQTDLCQAGAGNKAICGEAEVCGRDARRSVQITVGMLRIHRPGERYGFITCPELSETFSRDVYVTHGASCLLWPMLGSRDRNTLFVDPLQDYAGKWEVGTSVSFTVAVNDKGSPCLMRVAGAGIYMWHKHVQLCFDREATGEGRAADCRELCRGSS